MNEQTNDNVVMQPCRRRKERAIPEVGLFFANPSEAHSALEKMVAERGEKRFLFNSALVVNKQESFFAAGPAVGAPMAVMCLEKLIALGAKRIILVGWCGALKPTLGIGNVLSPGQALCGEGTSQYYSSDHEPLPSPSLTAWIRITLDRSGMDWQDGRVWSTDAPYRESRDLLARLHQENDIAAVDMEYSALCTVARFRGIDFAAAMLVSDEIWQQQWRPGFTTPAFQRRSQELAEVLMEGLAGCQQEGIDKRKQEK
jgi:uridine phosphorylase